MLALWCYHLAQGVDGKPKPRKLPYLPCEVPMPNELPRLPCEVPMPSDFPYKPCEVPSGGFKGWNEGVVTVIKPEIKKNCSKVIYGDILEPNSHPTQCGLE